MCKVSDFILFIAVLLAGLAGAADAEEQRPEDYCLIPVETGPTGGSAVSFRTTSTVAYIPGHPTPLFLGSPKMYFDREGFLRDLDRNQPNYLSKFYKSMNGNVFTLQDEPEVFDRNTGQFRSIDNHERDLLDEVARLRSQKAKYAQDVDNPAYVHWRSRPPTNVDVDISLVPGAWRLGRNARVIALPDPDQALIATSESVFWIKRRTADNPHLCSDVIAPPEMAVRIWVPPGTENLAPPNPIGGYWSIRNGNAVLFYANGRLFELKKDGSVYAILGADSLGFRSSYKLPGSEKIVVNGHRSFIIFENDEVIFSSEPLIDHSCCVDMRPFKYDRETGDLHFQEDWRLTLDGTLIEGGGTRHRHTVENRYFDFLEVEAGAPPVKSRDGLSLFSPWGSVRKAECGQEARCLIGAIQAAAIGDDRILVAATNGLFEFDTDTSVLERLVPNTALGSVRDVQYVPWEGLFIIEAAYGNFTWSAKQGLRIIGKVDRDSPHTKIFVVREAKRIVINGYPPKVLEFVEP